MSCSCPSHWSPAEARRHEQEAARAKWLAVVTDKPVRVDEAAEAVSHRLRTTNLAVVTAAMWRLVDEDILDYGADAYVRRATPPVVSDPADTLRPAETEETA